MDSCVIITEVSTNCCTNDVSSTTDAKPQKLRYHQWRKELKKKKKKAKRIAFALLRDAALGGEEDELLTELEQKERDEEERQRHLQNELWLEKEREAQALFLAKKDREEKDRLRKEEEEQKIKEEWAERQRKEKEEETRKIETQKKKIDEVNKKLQQVIDEDETKPKRHVKFSTVFSMSHCQEFEKKVMGSVCEDEVWQNPPAPPGYNAENLEPEVCPFFQKVGACRFGIRCNRAHLVPETSTTLLLPGMFASFKLEQSFRDEYDTDLSLEYEEDDLYKEFKEFYEDVLPEFKKFGRVTQFIGCRNFENHLRGNVYIQFASKEEALEAFKIFNGRWYGSRQLSCQFTAVENWKSAICGLFHHKKCPKGKNCNFLHVFKNPENEFLENLVDIRSSRRAPRNNTVRTPEYSERNRSFRRHNDCSMSRRSSSRISESEHQRTYSSKSPCVGSRSALKSHQRKNRSRSRSDSEQKHRQLMYRSVSKSHKKHKRSRSRSVSKPQKRHKRSRSRSVSKSQKKYKRSRSRSISKSHKKHKKTRSRSASKSYKRQKRSRSTSVTDSHRKHERLRSLSSSESSSNSCDTLTAKSPLQTSIEHRGMKLVSPENSGTVSPLSSDMRKQPVSISDCPTSYNSEDKSDSKSKDKLFYNLNSKPKKHAKRHEHSLNTESDHDAEKQQSKTGNRSKGPTMCSRSTDQDTSLSPDHGPLHYNDTIDEVESTIEEKGIEWSISKKGKRKKHKGHRNKD